MVPLLNDAGRTLRWFIEDVWGQFDDDLKLQTLQNHEIGPNILMI